MRTIRFLALCCAASSVLGCTESTAPTAPTAAVSRTASPAAPAAVVVYSNFGPDMAFDTDPSHGWGINGFLGPDIGQQAISNEFTPSLDYTFSDAQVPLVLLSGPASIRVFLQANANGLPGDVIEQVSIGAGLGATPTIIVANSVLSPILHKDTPYWLTIVAGAAGVIAGWNWNSIGDVSSGGSLHAVTQSGSPAGPWGTGIGITRSAFQIDGRPLTPQGAIQLLMNNVTTLLSGGVLNQGQAQGLMAKLTAATQSLNRANRVAACNQLQAFINQLKAFTNAGTLSVGTAHELIDSASGVRSQAGCES